MHYLDESGLATAHYVIGRVKPTRVTTRYTVTSQAYTVAHSTKQIQQCNNISINQLHMIYDSTRMIQTERDL